MYLHVQMQENVYEEGTDVSVTVGGALDQCDVACLLYDQNNPTSFDVATSMMVSVELTTTHLAWFHSLVCVS